MSEITVFRKNKIELSEYDYSQDIQNRILMSQFTPLDVEVLEEILYSSLRIPLSILHQNLDLTSDQLNPILEKLSHTKLFTVSADHVIVDKEMRKYYELQVLKFEEDFEPGMEYLQGLLRKVPIHVLPTWYSISRSSNNIFESIIDKYLLTPQIYQRHLMDLHFPDPALNAIIEAVFQSPKHQIDAADILEKFDLTQDQFEEYMILLEFSFACCIKFEKQGNFFKEVITTFHEWGQYLDHLKNNISQKIDESHIDRLKSDDFAVVKEMSALLELMQHESIKKETSILKAIQKKCPEFDQNDFDDLAQKLCDLNLADQHEKTLVCTSDSIEWLKMDVEERALFIYRHPLNSLEHEDVPEELCTQRVVREAEKCITPIANMGGWIFVDEFIDRIDIPLTDHQVISLKRVGRHWKYEFPKYNESEKNFFKAMIQQWLYEIGITALGTKDGRDCFCVTPFGQEMFGNE